MNGTRTLFLAGLTNNVDSGLLFLKKLLMARSTCMCTVNTAWRDHPRLGPPPLQRLRDEFVKFMKCRKNNLCDGTLNFSLELLILVAENKFAVLKVAKEWITVSTQEQIIHTLLTQIAEKVSKCVPKKPGIIPPARIEGGPPLPPAECFTEKTVPPKTTIGAPTMGFGWFISPLNVRSQ
jgi:hypothetical protein